MQKGRRSGMRGQRGGRGGPSKCICPNCGHEESHKRGQPCSSMKCPKCSTRMLGKWD